MRAIVAEIDADRTLDLFLVYSLHMNTKAMWSVLAILTLIIFGLTWVLFAFPAPAEAPTDIPNGEEPLHTRVSVLSPAKNAVVPKTFTVIGQAPGNWYFEASFPIEVQNASGTVLTTVVAQAQSDWMTTELVPFLANVTLTGSYTGPAKMILKRDNPSGLPENDDSLEVAIVIQ
jgi:uncharacterized iron-regulated membrane protein